MIRGIIYDGGGGIAPLVLQAEEDDNARLDCAGCGRLRIEVGDGLAVDGILMIIKGDDNLGGLAEILGRSIPREDKLPDEEHEVHEGPELE